MDKKALEEYLSSQEFLNAVREDSAKNKVKGTFNSDEVTHILKACREAGVAKFTYGDLVIEFHGVSSEERNPSPQVDPLAGQPPPHNDELLITPVDTEALEEMERSRLLIEDPSSFEEQMIKEDREEIRVREVEDTINSRFEQDL